MAPPVKNTYVFESSTKRLERKAEWDLPSDSEGGKLITGTQGRLFYAMSNNKVLEFTEKKVNDLHWNLMNWEIVGGYLVVVQVDFYQG